MEETGRVKWFKKSEGMGFIARDRGGRDAFVHASDLIGLVALNPGDAVTFDIVETAKGPNARNVRRNVISASEHQPY